MTSICDGVTFIPPHIKKRFFSPKKLQLYYTAIIFFTFCTVCTAFYSNYEGWSTNTSIGFVIVAMTTVGYGYQYPSDDNSRLFTIFVMIVGVFGVFGLINNVVVTRLETLNKRMEKKNSNMTAAELYQVHMRRLSLNVFSILAALFIAAGTFSLIEDWTFTRGLYFVVQTACTVGFGDVKITTQTAKSLLNFYIIFSTIQLAFAINNFSTLNANFERLKQSVEFHKKKETLSEIEELDTGNGVPKDTFILNVLIKLGVLDFEKDVEPWVLKFVEIDKDGSGTIEKEEIRAFALKEASNVDEELKRLGGTMGHSMGGLGMAMSIANTIKDEITNVAASPNLIIEGIVEEVGAVVHHSEDDDDYSDNESEGRDEEEGEGSEYTGGGDEVKAEGYEYGATRDTEPRDIELGGMPGSPFPTTYPTTRQNSMDDGSNLHHPHGPGSPSGQLKKHPHPHGKKKGKTSKPKRRSSGGGGSDAGSHSDTEHHHHHKRPSTGSPTPSKWQSHLLAGVGHMLKKKSEGSGKSHGDLGSPNSTSSPSNTTRKTAGKIYDTITGRLPNPSVNSLSPEAIRAHDQAVSILSAASCDSLYRPTGTTPRNVGVSLRANRGLSMRTKLSTSDVDDDDEVIHEDIEEDEDQWPEQESALEEIAVEESKIEDLDMGDIYNDRPVSAALAPLSGVRRDSLYATTSSIPAPEERESGQQDLAPEDLMMDPQQRISLSLSSKKSSPAAPQASRVGADLKRVKASSPLRKQVSTSALPSSSNNASSNRVKAPSPINRPVGLEKTNSVRTGSPRSLAPRATSPRAATGSPRSGTESKSGKITLKVDVDAPVVTGRSGATPPTARSGPPLPPSRSHSARGLTTPTPRMFDPNKTEGGSGKGVSATSPRGPGMKREPSAMKIPTIVEGTVSVDSHDTAPVGSRSEGGMIIPSQPHPLNRSASTDTECADWREPPVGILAHSQSINLHASTTAVKDEAQSSEPPISPIQRFANHLQSLQQQNRTNNKL